MTKACVATVLAGMIVWAQDAPQMPKPVTEHEWLQQLVGEWVAEGEVTCEPNAAAQKFKGSESGRMLGGFWAVLENKSEFMGGFTGILSIGYDPEKKKYIGTWIDSMGPTLWQYQGALDSAGKVLTLEAEGPCPMQPGKIAKFRESIEIKSKDHKVFTSNVQVDGKKWQTLMTINYRRKK